MSKINILDSSVFNRIAAGEVVERPSSVVKELVENSLDAGANIITVNIREGGQKSIQITDNGSGIEKEDMSKAFLPHATSKVKTVDDLDKISTLGFRGEALASIGSVSEANIVSKTRKQEYGHSVSVNGGVMTDITECASTGGTTVEIENLFFNVPARAKFLKSVRKEQSEITNLMARFILANPEVVFKYTADERLIYQSTGKGLKEAIYVVYGKDSLNNIIEVNSEYQGIKLTGFIGKPAFAKSNRTYQTLIVNGRYVINATVSAAAYSAYENFLMKGKFPFFVLNLEIPAEKLDVNVHPNKLDVKFENHQTIYGAIYSAVYNALGNANKANEVIETENSVFESKRQSAFDVSSLQKYSAGEGKSFSGKIDSPEEVKVVINEDKTRQEKANDLISSFSKISSTNTSEFKENTSMLTKAFNNELNAINAYKKQNFVQKSAFEGEELSSVDIKFIGVLFNTYLLVEVANKAYLIDQHAAHEKILYDKLVKELDDKQIATQGLLIPHILNLNAVEYAFILENLDSVKELGFEIEPFGNSSFKISGVPAILQKMDLNNFFNMFLQDIQNTKTTNNSDLIKERLKQKSCKAAVKAGDKLSNLEVKTLLNKMLNQNIVLLCPHGRPIVIELTKTELEKWFKRIV